MAGFFENILGGGGGGLRTAVGSPHTFFEREISPETRARGPRPRESHQSYERRTPRMDTYGTHVDDVDNGVMTDISLGERNKKPRSF